MKKIVSIILMFLVVHHVFSQTKSDSIKRLIPKQNDTSRIASYNNLFKLELKNNLPEAKKYLDTLMLMSEDSSLEKYIALAHRSKGVYYYFNSDYYTSEVAYLKSINLYRNLNMKESLSAVLNNLGIVQKYLGKFEESIEAHMESLKLKEELNVDPKYIVASLANIGALHSELGNIELAIDYAKKAEQLCLTNNLTRDLNLIRGNLAIEFKKNKQYQKALKYYVMVQRYLETQKNYRAEAKNLNSLGALYFEIDSLVKAKEYYLKSYKISDANGELQMIGLITRNLGIVSMKEKDYSKALEYFLKANEISMQTGTLNRNIADYLNISQAHAALGNFEEAYTNREIHFNKYDSIFKKEKIEKINELEIRYQTEKKEAEIALQQEEIKTLNEKARADKLKKSLFAGGMVSALALFGLSVFGFHQRIKKNRIAHQKQEEIYKQEIEHKKKELTSQTLHLVQKNTFIQELKENLENLKSSPEKFKTEFRRIVMLLKKENASDKDWEVFKTYFADVHNDFDQKLKTIYADISEKEIRLAAFLRMNLTTKEIAATLNVLPDSILKSKYRLKKKLNLDKDIDLTSFLNTL